MISSSSNDEVDKKRRRSEVDFVVAGGVDRSKLNEAERKQSIAGFNETRWTQLTAHSKFNMEFNNLRWLSPSTPEPEIFTYERYIKENGEPETDEESETVKNKLTELNHPWREWAKSMLYHRIVDPFDKQKMENRLEYERQNGNMWVLPDPTFNCLHWNAIKDYKPWWMNEQASKPSSAKWLLLSSSELGSSEEEIRLADNRYCKRIERVTSSIAAKHMWFEDGMICAILPYSSYQDALESCRRKGIKSPFVWVEDKKYFRAAANAFELANSLLCTAYPYSTVSQTEDMPLEKVCEMIRCTTRMPLKVNGDCRGWYVDKIRSGKRNMGFTFNEERMAYIVPSERLFEAWRAL